MKKLLMTLAGLLAVASGVEANDAPGGDRYGFHPALRKFFHIRPSAGCASCGPTVGGPAGVAGVGGYGYGSGGFGAGGGQAANPAQSGTLVFPNHPFARSPRDFFQQ